MARVLITGSSSGLGLMAGQLLLEEGHEVVLHARDKSRDPGIAEVVLGDVTTMAEVRSVAAQANTHHAVSDPTLQDAFLARCAELTGTTIE